MKQSESPEPCSLRLVIQQLPRRIHKMPSDDTLWLYTSLTAGSSHIITATSRIETILKANKIPFKAVDIATNEKARLIWQRRSKGKKIPGLVKFNDVVAVSVQETILCMLPY